MKELSLHILDIAQNSIVAKATRINIEIYENTEQNVFRFSIADNGCGMSKEFVDNVTDPFVTTRKTRKVGLGISLLKAAAEQAGGGITLVSEKGVGTTITATFLHDSIDRQPLGDMAGTLVSLVSMNTDVDFFYTHTYNGEVFEFSTQEVKQILGPVGLDNADVSVFLQGYLLEGIRNLYGGLV